MKYLLFIFCLVCSRSTPLLSQSQYGSYGLEYYGGYSRLNLLNTAFAKSLNSGEIDHKLPSYEIGGRIVTRFIIMNGSFLYNKYQATNNNNPMLSRNIVFVRGGEAGLSLVLTPLFSKNFLPYLGIGYFGGSINLSEKVTTGTGSSQTSKNNILATTTLRSPLWKFGLMLAYKRVSLTAEYKQALAFDDNLDKAFQQFALTIAYRPPYFINGHLK